MSNPEMKLVYRLEDDLSRDPDQVALTQALTLDQSRPDMGLRGAHGLFGSPEWWASIRNGQMRLMRSTGVIESVYTAGQDARDEDNEFVLRQDDGTTHTESCYVNHDADRILFKVGHRVEIAYALDELKERGDNGEPLFSEIVLSMAVSTKPVIR